MRALVDAVETNFAAHFALLPSRLGMLVRDEPELLLVDSGLPSDTLNVVARVAFTEPARIAELVAHFRARDLPFAWWQGPSAPPSLPDALVAAGLSPGEPEPGMTLELSHLRPPPVPRELEIRRVRTAGELADFARVVAANRTPPDGAVLDFYARAATVALSGDGAARFYVGYVDGEPVASSEGFVAAGLVGVYGVATRREFRRRGFGAALTVAPLVDARAGGIAVATLQASAQGAPIYARLGFETITHFVEYHQRDGKR